MSYAPSINNSTYNDIIQNFSMKESLKNMFAVSVRDKYSQKVIEDVVGHPINLVCDPTMLIDIEVFRQMQTRNTFNEYILVYGPERCFSNCAIKAIKEYAMSTNKKLLAYYFYHEWCDKTLYGTPFNFLGLIDNADFVFTSTFHGTIFSIMYNKRFVIFDQKENRKVQELLKDFDLNVNYSKDIAIIDLLNQNYNYNKINQKILEIREKSEEYLFKNLEKMSF